MSLFDRPPRELTDPEYAVKLIYSQFEGEAKERRDGRAFYCPPGSDYHRPLNRCVIEGSRGALGVFAKDYLRRVGRTFPKSPRYNYRDRLIKFALTEPVRYTAQTTIKPIQKLFLEKVWGHRSNRGNIPIYRMIKAEPGAVRFKGVGRFWAYDPDCAKAYQSDDDPYSTGDKILLVGEVDPSSVNWLASLILTLNYGVGTECEVRLKQRAKIHIVGWVDPNSREKNIHRFADAPEYAIAGLEGF